ncbi:hypothetical protein OEZ85_002413 [Tetradesmus obliquus]|uniref:Uncharacterized protein n=1 Tax=Tetradesmus obliquus TaxID=3088 RepID=A0ABY8U379_TETOB|nr:hypothetical protein OEZ85_002413 [Tetradesmus obliquus]
MRASCTSPSYEAPYTMIGASPPAQGYLAGASSDCSSNLTLKRAVGGPRCGQNCHRHRAADQQHGRAGCVQWRQGEVVNNDVYSTNNQVYVLEQARCVGAAAGDGHAQQPCQEGYFTLPVLRWHARGMLMC